MRGDHAMRTDQNTKGSHVQNSVKTISNGARGSLGLAGDVLEVKEGRVLSFGDPKSTMISQGNVTVKDPQ